MRVNTTDVRRQVMRLLADAEQRVLRAEDLVSWATALLAGGTESPAVVRLAGLDLGGSPNVFEAQAAFDQALVELGIEAPRDRDSLLRGRLVDISDDLLASRITADEALARAHRFVLGPLNHPADLMPWCYLGDELDPVVYKPLTRQEVEHQVKELARDTLERWAGRRTRG
jgi:hypothetical protein